MNISYTDCVTEQQDHVGVTVVYHVPLEDSFHVLRNSMLRAAKEFMKYIFFGRGLFLCPITQLAIFARSKLLDNDSHVVKHDAGEVDSTVPDNIVDIEIMPVAHNCAESAVETKNGVFSFIAAVLQPKSYGSVRLRSADPSARPECDLGFFTNPLDYVVMRKAVKLAVALGDEMRNAGYPMSDYIVPARHISDKELDSYIRENARSTFHYASTCRMAPETDSRPGVVDDELRVYGVDGLRVADCSVMPDIIANHLQAPAVMIGEKCAQMIRGKFSECRA